ncbi:MAG: hypothetical protein J5449_11155 [Oscillospiraceae bacterium]|nr:hypothetical protein [Oscillospiraceae bacterium]
MSDPTAESGISLRGGEPRARCGAFGLGLRQLGRERSTEKVYIGYLETRDASTYLCEVLSTMIKGILENNNNRMRSLLFKWCVELNMACHTIAAHFGASEIERRELRAFAAREVKETNGQISFDHALDKQRKV